MDVWRINMQLTAKKIHAISLLSGEEKVERNIAANLIDEFIVLNISKIMNV